MTEPSDSGQGSTTFDELFRPLGTPLAQHEQDHPAHHRETFHFKDFAQVVRQGPIGDEFDVVQTDHLVSAVVDRSQATRHVHDRIAQRLPHRTAPAGLERSHDLVAAVGRWPRRQPERIGTPDAGEIDGQIRHGGLVVR